MRLPLALMVLLATTAGCLGGDAQTRPTGQIDGAALNHVLVPYGNVTVRLLELERETTTTKLGGFSFYDVPVGFHTIELDLPGIGIDREVVDVEEQHISRVILQVYPDATNEPHVTLRSDVEIVQMAMPGASCDECTWRTALSEGQPAAVELLVEWDPRHPVVADWRTALVVELRDQDGNLVAGPLEHHHVDEIGDLFVLHEMVEGKDLPHGLTSLKMHFTFDEDNEAPHPDFQVDSRICLHYVQTEPRTACSI